MSEVRGSWATQPGPRQEPPPLGAQQRSCVSHVFRAAGVQQMGWPRPVPVLQAGTWAAVLLVLRSLWSSEVASKLLSWSKQRSLAL